MIGWRKLSAWLLVYTMATVATFMDIAIPDNNVDLIKWVTGFFFGTNALIHGVAAAKSVLKPGPKNPIDPVVR